jgi:hypothetical protein
MTPQIFVNGLKKNYLLKSNGRKLPEVRQLMNTLGEWNFIRITLTYQQNLEAKTPFLQWDRIQGVQHHLVFMI